MKSSGFSPVFPDETSEFRVPSGISGVFPDESAENQVPSGISDCFPDDTDGKGENGKPSGNRRGFPDGLLYLFRIELAEKLVKKTAE